MHEQLTDEYDGPNIRPIQSYFETADLSRLVQGQSEYLRITTIEPDFVQSGPMTVQVTGRANARAPEVYSTIFTFPETASAPYEQIVMLKEQRRELRVRFESNTSNTLVVEDFTGIIEASRELKGVISGATYTISTFDVYDYQTTKLQIVPNPLTANADDDFGFTETFTEFPNIT